MGIESYMGMTTGVCYYPEHWEEKDWKPDLLQMLENGIHVVRVAEFAWSFFEPEEGVFTFDFFDRFLEVARETGMKVIFCTPTATPPAWASNQYPEILNANRQGVLYRHGHRRHYNYNSPKYRELTRNIVTRLAEHYAGHPAIIGWQLDNEFNCGTDEFYSQSDSLAFRVYLRKKYGTLEALNKAWGTVFWNQSYTSWEEVFVPRPTVAGYTNPHMELEFIRFISQSTREFAKLQSDILRQYLPKETFITTNGIFGNVDNHAMTEESLDFITYDSYPNFAYDVFSSAPDPKEPEDRKWSRNLAQVRSICPHFGIMEQQSGPCGSVEGYGSPTPNPGQIKLWTLQSVAHGADFVSYFRWKTATIGSEIYWHGILDYDGRENRRLREVRETAAGLQKLRDAAGSTYKASFALLQDYDNLWDNRVDPWMERIDRQSQKAWFQASQKSHIPMDYLYLRENTTLEQLQRYPLLVYPHGAILRESTVRLLEAYVEQGGTLILGCRTGFKDEYGRCLRLPAPGLARGLSGATVEEFTFLRPEDPAPSIRWGEKTLEASVFADLLSPDPEGEVLATFEGGCFYAGTPALVRKQTGRGAVYAYASAFTEESARAFLEALPVESPFAPYLEGEEACELALREKEGKKFLFVLNYSKEPREIFLKQPMEERLEGKLHPEGKEQVEPYGVRVFAL